MVVPPSLKVVVVLGDRLPHLVGTSWSHSRARLSKTMMNFRSFHEPSQDGSPCGCGMDPWPRKHPRGPKILPFPMYPGPSPSCSLGQSAFCSMCAGIVLFPLSLYLLGRAAMRR